MLTLVDADGAGLFCGVLRHLLKRGSDCPKTLIATHFHDVFNEELLDPEHIPVSFRHMQVMFTTSSGAIVESDSHDTGVIGGSPSISIATYDDLRSTKIGPAEKITYLYR